MALSETPTDLGSYQRGLLLVTLAPICFSIAGPLIRYCSAPALTITFWRSSFCALALLAYLTARHRRELPRAFAAVGSPGIVYALLLAAIFPAYIVALDHATVANVLVITGTAPVFASLYAWRLLGEPIRAHSWGALIAVLVGLVVMFGGGIAAGALLGNALSLAVALGAAGMTVVLRFARGRDMTPAVCLGSALSALAVLPFAGPVAVGAGDFGRLLVLGTVQLALGLILLTHGARHVPALEISLLALLETLLGPLWTWLLTGEEPGAASFLGGALIVAALVLNTLLGARAARA